MLHNTGLQTAIASPVIHGAVDEFSIAGVTADDSLMVIEKKMRLYKLSQYEQRSAKAFSNQLALCVNGMCTTFFPKAA